MYQPKFTQNRRITRIMLPLLVVCLLAVGNSYAQILDSVPVCRDQKVDCLNDQTVEVKTFQNTGRPAMLGSGGNALNFDGANDSVTAALPALFNNLAANNFTFEAWVYPTGSAFSRIIFAQSSSANFATITIGTDNRIYFYVVAGGITYSMVTIAAIPGNDWTHVAARWTAATNSPEIFFDGILQPGTDGGTSSTGTNNLMTIGTRPGGAQYFPGTLDEVRVWSSARTQPQIAANFNVEITPQPNLVDYYKFNQGIPGGNNAGITTLNDSSTPFNNGTLSNFALNGTTSNWIASTAPITVATAASVSISGQVLEQNGRGISGAIVRLTDMNGEVLTVRTNTFGYFRFPEIAAGQTYVFSAQHKAHSFDSQVINILEDLQDLTITANNP